MKSQENIVESLERCVKAAQNSADCSDCLFVHGKHCAQIFASDILTLLKEKDYEIAGLEAENDRLKEINRSGIDLLNKKR